MLAIQSRLPGYPEMYRRRSPSHTYVVSVTRATPLCLPVVVKRMKNADSSEALSWEGGDHVAVMSEV